MNKSDSAQVLLDFLDDVATTVWRLGKQLVSFLSPQEWVIRKQIATLDKRLSYDEEGKLDCYRAIDYAVARLCDENMSFAIKSAIAERFCVLVDEVIRNERFPQAFSVIHVNLGMGRVKEDNHFLPLIAEKWGLLMEKMAEKYTIGDEVASESCYAHLMLSGAEEGSLRYMYALKNWNKLIDREAFRRDVICAARSASGLARDAVPRSHTDSVATGKWIEFIDDLGKLEPKRAFWEASYARSKSNPKSIFHAAAKAKEIEFFQIKEDPVLRMC